jgi:hypothetical protein
MVKAWAALVIESKLKVVVVAIVPAMRSIIAAKTGETFMVISLTSIGVISTSLL